MKIVGIDLGSDSIKGCYGEGEDKLISIPHRIGLGRERGQLSNKIDPIKNLDINYHGKRYFVGHLAKESFSVNMNAGKSRIHDYTKLFVLSLLSNIEEEVFNVVITLPIAEYKNQRKELAKLLIGKHEFYMRGVKKFIIIEDVSVYPQAVAGLWSEYITKKGTQIKEMPSRIGAIDIGFRDFNFAYLEDGEFIDKMSWSFPQGMHTAFIATLQEKSDYTLDEITPDIVPSYHYVELREQIMSTVSRYWKHIDFPIACLGGGSHWVSIGDQIKNPVSANAEGCFSIGVMKYA